MENNVIEQNISEINKRIQNAALESGRQKEDVLLLAVTKTVPVNVIKEAVKCGITDLGENRVQELLPKLEQISANWHLIGHLQTNKVKYVAGIVNMIHSVDSVKVAKEIDRISKSKGIVQDVLLEVNIADEDTKFGVSYNNAKEIIKHLWEMQAIRVKGLMTVAPYVDEGKKNSDLFKKMRHLFVDINSMRGHNEPMIHLSMGMSGDYEEAILQGATIVRIGTGIFGGR